MQIKSLCVVAFAFFAGSALAQPKWIPATSSETQRIYFDKESASRTKNGFRIWLLTDFAQPRETPNGNWGYSAKSRIAIDCGNETFAGEHVIGYAAPMGEGSIIHRDDSGSTPRPIVPGSVPYALKLIFCPR